MTADEFLGLVQAYQLSMRRFPNLVVINPIDQDEIEDDVERGAPDPQAAISVERDDGVPVGQPRFPPV